MKKIALLTAIILTGMGVWGQSGTPTTVCSGSLWFIGMDYSWAGTIGEAFTSTLDGDYDLTQGFHQPEKTISGIDDPFQIESIFIYPNPTKNFLNLSIRGNDLPDQVELHVSDLSGRTVYQDEVSTSAKINLSHLSHGLYIMNISRQGHTIATSKISKL